MLSFISLKDKLKLIFSSLLLLSLFILNYITIIELSNKYDLKNLLINNLYHYENYIVKINASNDVKYKKEQIKILIKENKKIVKNLNKFSNTFFIDSSYKKTSEYIKYFEKNEGLLIKFLASCNENQKVTWTIPNQNIQNNLNEIITEYLDWLEYLELLIILSIFILIFMINSLRKKILNKVNNIKHIKTFSQLFNQNDRVGIMIFNSKLEIIYNNLISEHWFNVKQNENLNKIVDKNIINEIKNKIEKLKESPNQIFVLQNKIYLSENNLELEMNLAASETEQNEKLYMLTIENISIDKKFEIEETKRIIKKLSHYDHTIKSLSDKFIFNKSLDSLKNKITCDVGIIFIDIDNFSSINETFGFEFGDLISFEIKNRLKKILNKEDLILKVGGEEFFIVFENIEDNVYLEEKANEIYDVLNEIYIIKDKKIYLNLCIGGNLYPKYDQNIELILKEMEGSINYAKTSNKSNISLYHKMQKNHNINIYDLENNLLEALENKSLELFFQPQFNKMKNQIVGAESLLRWKFENNYISPFYFIPVAERSELIIKVEEFVIDESFKMIVELERKNLLHPHFKLSINISVIHLESFELELELEKKLKQYKISPRFIEIEITESAIINNKDLFIAKIDKLREMGFYISLDDFGTGYSSLSYLSRLPLDKLKIDKSFVNDIGDNEHSEEVIKAIISISQALNMDVIAEGVETEEQIDYLYNNNCKLFQGFYYYKPLQKKDFLIELKKDFNK